MTRRRVPFRLIGFASVFLLQACGLQDDADVRSSLEGSVQSAAEGPMEGVVVSARKVGSTITVSVVSDDKGMYAFPVDRLSPGHYNLTVRAAGYELAAPADAEVRKDGAATANLDLIKLEDPSPSMSDADWLISVPGSHDQKSLLLNCTSCHSLNLPLTSLHDAAQFEPLIQRMLGAYTHQSQPGDAQSLPRPRIVDPARVAELARYLAEINADGGSKWNYPLKVLPRVKGEGTRVVITQYDLSRPMAQPHDVVVDGDGIVWYADFSKQFLGKLDPRTGENKEYPIPIVHPDLPKGNLGVEAGPDGKIWIAMHSQVAIGAFDPQTEKFRIYPLPDHMRKPSSATSQFATLHQSVDGKIWTMTGADTVGRLDVDTGAWEIFYPFKNASERSDEKDAFKYALNATSLPHLVYGVVSDSKNNAYVLDFYGRSVFKIDARTGEVTEYSTSTPFSMPRRGSIDNEDRLWFAQYNAGRIAMLDTKTGDMTEWEMPTPWTNPYDVAVDKEGYAWTAGMHTDRVVRFDPRTGSAVEYQLPLRTNVRRVFVDNHGPRPAFWVGSNHGASIIKVEPLD